MSETYTLHRTGQSPLTFSGEMLAESTGKWHAGQERKRWHDLAIYRTDGGKHVVSIVYQTCWQGEHGHYCAAAVESAAAVANTFRDYDPAERVQRLPENYGKAREDQDRNIRVLVQDYQERVTQVLGNKFAERID